jgi:hypothetical protein
MESKFSPIMYKKNQSPIPMCALALGFTEDVNSRFTTCDYNRVAIRIRAEVRIKSMREQNQRKIQIFLCKIFSGRIHMESKRRILPDGPYM